MLKADQIERSNDQPPLGDEIQPSKSPDPRKPELRIDRRDAPPIAPAAPKRPRGTIAALAERWSGFDRNQRIRWSMFALLPIAAAFGAYWYVAGGQVMSTDDAYVDADKVGVSTDVSGIVQDVDVRDNQHVAAGEIFTGSIPVSSRSRSKTRKPIWRRRRSPSMR